MDTYIFNDYSLNYSYRNNLLNYFKDKGEILNYRERTYIISEYEKLDYVYLVLNGRVKQSFVNYHGTEKTILLLTKGDMFGEIAMIQEGWELLTTETLLPTTVCKIGKNAFDRCLKNNPILYNDILIMATTKLRMLMTQLYDLSFFDSKSRLYFLLNRIALNHGVKCNKGTIINLKQLTHQDIATMIGCTRSTVTRLLKELAEENKIIRDGKYIIVPNQ